MNPLQKSQRIASLAQKEKEIQMPDYEWMEQKLQQVVALVLEQQAKGNTAFFSFSGHVNQISIQVFNGLWTEKEKPAISRNIYLDYKDVEVRLIDLIEDLSTFTRLEDSLPHPDSEGQL